MLETKNSYFLLFYAIVMGVPITMYSSNSFQLPMTTIALPVAFIAYILHPLSKEKFALTVAFLLSIISTIIFSISYDKSLIRSLLSQIWFFSPYLFFFLGYISFKNKYTFMKFVKYLSISSSLSIYVLFIDIMISNQGIVRGVTLNESSFGVESGATINGTILGLKLYAAWGVNSLATYFLIIHATFLTFIFNKLSQSILVNMFILGALSITAYLIIFSLSRSTIIGLLGLYIGLLFVGGNRHSKKLIAMMVITASIVIIVNWSYIDKFFEVKLSRSVDAYNHGDYADILSGRSSIFNIMLDQISSNIFLGRGFSGFGDMSVYLSTSSPHNQFLGALWKMGFIAFLPYLYFISRLYKKYTSEKVFKDRLLSFYSLLFLIILIALNLVWDNYTVPLVGAVIMFVSGAMFKIAGEMS